MSPESELRLERLLSAILQKLEQLSGAPKPHFSRRQFAELTGLSVWTIGRKIKNGEIPTIRGRIPAAELKRYAAPA